MQTSGPIRKDVDFRHDNDYGEVVPIRVPYVSAFVSAPKKKALANFFVSA